MIYNFEKIKLLKTFYRLNSQKQRLIASNKINKKYKLLIQKKCFKERLFITEFLKKKLNSMSSDLNPVEFSSFKNIIKKEPLSIYNTTIKNIKKIKNIDPKWVDLCGILIINSGANNISFTFTNFKYEVIYPYSCGRLENIKKSNRSNYFMMLETITSFLKFLESKGVSKIQVNLKGSSLIKKVLIKGLLSSTIRVLNFNALNSVSHNGCRPKKYRRI